MGLINYFLLLPELLLRGDDTEFNRDFIGYHAGVFPFAFTDVVGQAFDRQDTFKDLVVAFFFDG